MIYTREDLIHEARSLPPRSRGRKVLLNLIRRATKAELEFEKALGEALDQSLARGEQKH